MEEFRRFVVSISESNVTAANLAYFRAELSLLMNTYSVSNNTGMAQTAAVEHQFDQYNLAFTP